MRLRTHIDPRSSPELRASTPFPTIIRYGIFAERCSWDKEQVDRQPVDYREDLLEFFSQKAWVEDDLRRHPETVEDEVDTQHVDPANPWRNTHPQTLKSMAGVGDDVSDAAIDFLFDR